MTSSPAPTRRRTDRPPGRAQVRPPPRHPRPAVAGAELPRKVPGPRVASSSPTANSSGCWTKSSPPTSSPRPTRSATASAFTRDDGTPLNFTLVNIHDWCKNDFEFVSQLRINTDYSHHRHDVLLLINGVPVIQIELKTLGINPRRAIEQIVDYKNDPGGRLHPHAAVLCSAFHRQQPRQHLVLRQQQRPPLRLQRG